MAEQQPRRVFHDISSEEDKDQENASSDSDDGSENETMNINMVNQEARRVVHDISSDSDEDHQSVSSDSDGGSDNQHLDIPRDDGDDFLHRPAAYNIVCAGEVIRGRPSVWLF
ncbi:hypothetical protein PG996_004859 [Apiospora saccharicola]|uniref:Uncharacterized protein n=1 Tax=Apiospora saccharicola TaxID=335842 RepID=A0ABR1VMI7_9PEZI